MRVPPNFPLPFGEAGRGSSISRRGVRVAYKGHFLVIRVRFPTPLQTNFDIMIEQKKKEYAAKIEAWKKQHGKVKMRLIDDEKAAFFKQPTRLQVQCAESMMMDDDGKVDIHKKAERLIADCYLGGDYGADELLNDIELYTAVSKFVIFKLVEEKKTVSTDC